MDVKMESIVHGVMTDRMAIEVTKVIDLEPDEPVTNYEVAVELNHRRGLKQELWLDSLEELKELRDVLVEYINLQESSDGHEQ